MNFIDRISSAPRSYDPDRAADALLAVPWATAGLAPVISGAGGCSPYLLGLLQTEGGWLEGALENPEAAFETILSDIVESRDLDVDLRQAKRRVALLTGLADVAGVWPLEMVTKCLSDFANACVDVCIKQGVADEISRGKIPGMTIDDVETAAGMMAIAMGKMGAGELNYSSDIDLICLFDETRFDPDDYHDARAAFIRVTRKMTATLSNNTAGGYVFRTDLRLRPDASVTPVCLSMEAAERYYESVGRTWERAAFIKAAPSGGDVEAVNRFLKTLEPFVWRKHLDFAAIEDAHDMRLRIRDHKGLGRALELEGHNMKLGRGGIREIEFFTQTRQLIAGGRDPSLRVRGTREGLNALAAADWIQQDVADTLYGHYAAHRTVEHRLQMIQDLQTHDLPQDDDGFERLAAFLDKDTNVLRRELKARLDEVHTLTEDFFAPDTAPTVSSNWGADTTSRWPTYPALRSDRASEIFKRLWPDICAKMQDAAKPDEALAQFDSFLAGLPAGVQLFSLFEANPQLTQLIVDIAATAPALAQHLSRNSGVLDAVIAGDFFAEWPQVKGLTQQLTEELDAASDYEAQLITARRWAREWHFRIGVHQLRGLIDADVSGTQYADLAEATIAALWPCVVAEFSRKHGDLPGLGAVVIGMGSLGARRLNATSDLDLIVIYNADGVEDSQGKRPLMTRIYYSRLTQALVTALSAPMAEGRLYEVDMRLRPSGRQGPVATSITSFTDYQQNEAWTWEHLALTRARRVAGSSSIGETVDIFRAGLLAQKGKGDDVLGNVQDMRDRLADAKPGEGVWDVKSGAGRLQDIELMAQTAALKVGAACQTLKTQIDAGVASGWLSDADGTALRHASGLFWKVQAAGRLLTGGVLDPVGIGEGGRRLVLREAGFETMDDLAQALDHAAQAAARVIDAKLGVNI